MSLPTLLEISDELLELERAIDDAGGELTETIDAWLARLGADRDAKIDNYAALIDELEARSHARTMAAKKLELLATADYGKANALRARLKWFFEQHHIRKIETARHRLTLRDNGGVVPIEIDGEVPAEFLKQRITVEPDKSRIRAALEAGQVLPFARFGARGNRLEVK